MTRLRGKLRMFVAALFLCCAAVFGQSTSREVSAQVGAVIAAGAPSSAVDARVLGEYSGMTAASSVGHALGGAAWAASGKVLSGSEAGRMRGGMNASAIRAGLTESSISHRMRNRAGSMSLRLTPDRLRRLASRYGLQGAALSAACSGISASVACREQTITVLDKASYSEGFADSTRGTALLSPPDAGTSSPLEWSPSGVGSGELSFMPHRFLNPSLHVGTGVRSRSGGHRNQGRKSTTEQPGFSPLQNPLLQGNTLAQPSPGPSLMNSGSGDTGLGVLSSPLDTDTLGTDNGLSGGLNPQ